MREKKHTKKNMYKNMFLNIKNKLCEILFYPPGIFFWLRYLGIFWAGMDNIHVDRHILGLENFKRVGREQQLAVG